MASEVEGVGGLFGNCDGWGAAEWFERMANAIMEHDKAVVAGDMLSAETYRMVAASSGMTLVRGYRTQIRAALVPATTLATLQAAILEKDGEIAGMRTALQPFATYMGETGDLDNLGNRLPDDHGVGWVYLTIGDFRRAALALSSKDEI